MKITVEEEPEIQNGKPLEAERDLWSAFASFDDDQLQRLFEEIVQEVKLRAPGKMDLRSVQPLEIPRQESCLYFLQYSYPRSGSTIVWNVLDALISPQNTEDKDRFFYPENVIKTHDIDYVEQYFNHGGKVSYRESPQVWCSNIVMPIRHPEGTVLSLLRTGMKGATPSAPFVGGASGEERATEANITQKLQNYIDHYKWLQKRLDDWTQDSPPYLLFDYERHIKNLSQLLLTLEDQTGILILDKEGLAKRFSPKNINKNNKLKDFKEQDNTTLLHGDHIKKTEYPLSDKIKVAENPLFSDAVQLYLQIRNSHAIHNRSV